jgi:hypothetical protein
LIPKVLLLPFLLKSDFALQFATNLNTQYQGNVRAAWHKTRPFSGILVDC